MVDLLLCGSSLVGGFVLFGITYFYIVISEKDCEIKQLIKSNKDNMKKLEKKIEELNYIPDDLVRPLL